MFERLDDQARAVADAAVAAAHELGNGWLGTEHVLLGALTFRSSLPLRAQRLLPEAAEVRGRLTDGIRSSARRASDDVLLRSLGIDVSEVRRRAAETFGDDAVRHAARRVRVARRGRRRGERPPRCILARPGDALAVAPRLKRALEQAGRAGGRPGERSITLPALLHALMGVEDGLAYELLVRMGVDVAAVRAALAV